MEKVKMINVKDLLGVEDVENEEPSPEEKQVGTIKLDQLVPFKNHQFRLYTGKRLDDMVESIKSYGIIMPLIIRPINNEKYEILSGHNRINAAKIAGIKELPGSSFVIKKGLTDFEAKTIVMETNVIQRGFFELSYSEKAAVLAERHDTIKQEGKRKELISEIENLYKADNLEENSDLGKVCPQGNIRDLIGDKYDLSPRMISYYLRINTLTDEIKEKLDKGEIPFIAGVNLSFLTKDEQETVNITLESYNYKIDLKKSELLKNFSRNKSLNDNKIIEILSGKYFSKSKKTKSFKFTSKFKKNLSRFFKENQNQKEIEEIINKALELYFENHSE